MEWQEYQFDKTLMDGFLALGESNLISRLLANRKIPLQELDKFKSARHTDLSDPYSLVGVKEARECLLDAAQQGMTGAIIGDYDCDGVCSSALARFLMADLGIVSETFLPDRMEHGYGLNDKTIAAFCDRFSNKRPEIVMIVDCGASSEDKIKILREFGIKKIIVVDHHIIDPANMTKSADAMINWRTCGFNEQCAAGEMYTLARTFDDRVNLAGMIPYAAVGTIADVMPIVGDNRIIVRNGLDSFPYSRTPGLNILARTFSGNFKQTNPVFAISQEDISFKVAPKINAVGRLYTAHTAHDAVCAKEKGEAYVIAQELEAANKERKIVQAEMVEQAAAKLFNAEPEGGIVLYDPTWKIGVVGIVASRIVEKYGLPCLIFGNNNGVVKGSGRSVEGINLKSVMDSCSELFSAYGGHEMAAGATLKAELASDMKYVSDRFSAACLAHAGGKVVKPPTKFDMVVTKEDLTNENIMAVRAAMYPFCKKHNPEPIFKLSGVEIENFMRKEGVGWTRVEFFCKDILYKFESFSIDITEDQLAGKKANVYFSFPQNLSYDYDPKMKAIKLEVADE